MAYIEMRKGLQLQIDQEDLEWASQWSWCSNEKRPGCHYAYRSIHGGRKHIHLHRSLMQVILSRKLKPNEEVDHINGNTLDNRRANLRLATRQQQCWNSAPQTHRGGRPVRSKYKGVRYKVPSRPGGPLRRKPWAAQIVKDGTAHSLGYYRTEQEAALAYNEAAERIFGQYARLNEL